jgi:hypothetical protein
MPVKGSVPWQYSHRWSIVPYPLSPFSIRRCVWWAPTFALSLTSPVSVAVPEVRAVFTGGATTYLLVPSTVTVPVPWHLVQVLFAVLAPHVGEPEPWQRAVEQLPLKVVEVCFVTFNGYPAITSILPSAWPVVGVVVCVVPALWHCVQSVTLCVAWLPVFGPEAAIAMLWHAVHPADTPQTGVVTVPVPYTLLWQAAVEQVPEKVVDVCFVTFSG